MNKAAQVNKAAGSSLLGNLIRCRTWMAENLPYTSANPLYITALLEPSPRVPRLSVPLSAPCSRALELR